MTAQSPIKLHGRTYALPSQPTVIVCVDGFDPEYLHEGIASGIIPNMTAFVNNGFHVTAHSCMPSFTNPNNVSIVTGAPPAIHGIAGNFFLDNETGEEKMVTDDTLLRGDTILQLMTQRGVRVAAVTAKDKLRRILSHGLYGTNAISFSSEYAGSCTLEDNGIENVEAWMGRKAPPQYSGDLSIYVLDAGVKLLAEKRADLLYLTLSDYIQHKHAPNSPEANEFFVALDERIGKMVELGAVVAVTGDHGMSDKCGEGGRPNILFLEDVLAEKWGPGAARVICPITDPFVRHHGALGSFVRVHVKNKENVPGMMELCKTLQHVNTVMGRNDASEIFEMPLDREGDFVVVSEKDAVIGGCEAEHDLSNINDHRLRSHGGTSEQEIPLLLSRPARDLGFVAKRDQWKNYDAFDLALNCQ